MDKVRLRVAFLPVTDEERGDGVVRMKVDPKYKNILHAYGVEHKDTLGDSMVVIEPWNWDPSKEAIAFFHKVRDMIVEQQSGALGERSNSEKEDLKMQLKEEFGARVDGELKSLTAYTRAEMWKLNQGAVDWLYEAGGNLGSLRVDFERLKNDD